MSVDRSLMIVIYGRTKCQLVGELLETKVQLRFFFFLMWVSHQLVRSSTSPMGLEVNDHVIFQ
jgi:hypothetical protein